MDFLDLAPLSFFEFLEALGENELLELLKNHNFDMISVFSDKLKEYLKIYYYVGGMPEVVDSYMQEKNLLEVRQMQKKIIGCL